MKQFMEISPDEYHEVIKEKTVVQSDERYSYTEYYYACPNYGVNSWRRYLNMDYNTDVRPIIDEDILQYKAGTIYIHTKETVLDAFVESKYGSLDDIADSLIHNEDVKFDQTSS